MNSARALTGALLTLVLSGCVRLDLQAALADHGTARGPAAAAAVRPDPTAASSGATPTPAPSPADGVISDWGVPVAFATFLVLVVGGLVVGYMVSRRQRTEG